VDGGSERGGELVLDYEGASAGGLRKSYPRIRCHLKRIIGNLRGAHNRGMSVETGGVARNRKELASEVGTKTTD